MPKLTKGTLRVHRDGYGFVIPDEPLEHIEGDIFIPPEAAQKAMHGDRVLVRVKTFRGRAEGEIMKILDRGHTTVVGEFRIRRKGNFVKPMDERIQHWIRIPDGMEIPLSRPNPDRIAAPVKTVSSLEDLDGQIVNVEILDYPGDDNPATGRVMEILGNRDDFGVDVEIVIRKHHIPHEFPEDVLAEARTLQPFTGISGREDFRQEPCITIDGETARDFDDAVWVGKLENGNFALHVHIADVAHYVRPGTAIDREAQMRGTSVYFPDRAVPMLPVELSTDLCSLKPGVDRPTVSAILEIDHSGDVVHRRFARSVIHSSARMTYTKVHEILESPHPPPGYALMRDLALILNKKRVRRGSIDFDLPEAIIEFDEFGGMIGVARGIRNVAHRIIEEFMLAANEAVATHFTENGIPALYRIHEQPDPRRVQDFEELAARFGASLGFGGVRATKHTMVQRTRDGRKPRRDFVTHEVPGISPRHYQRLVDKISGKPEERVLSYLMLRSLKQARYSPDNEGHFALATENYLHFTSPIRRYPDLVVHRILTGEAHPSIEELRPLGDDCSFTERRAADAERELVEWKKAKFMLDHLGDHFAGVIVSVTKFGFFVELDNLFIEGLVAIEALPGDKYRFDEGSRRIIGSRTRRQFSIGDRLTVMVARVDALERRIYFALPGGPSGRGKGGAATRRR